MNNLTEDQRKDSEERLTKFRDEYVQLTQKYQVDFFCYPQFIPTQEGSFVTNCAMQLVDRKYAPVPSPLNGIIQEK